MSESPIYQGILDDARKAADRAAAEAKAEAEELLGEARLKAEKEREQERRNTKARLDALALREESALRSAKRAEELHSSDAISHAVMKAVNEYFNSYFGKKEARATLISWIAEAARGLGKSEAKVSFCKGETVDESMLREAEKLLEEKSSLIVHLTLDREHPITGWGVQLSSTDERVYFNNQLDVRMRRLAKEIKKIIQESTCKAE